MCVSVANLAKEGVKKITINDVLAFQCMFCGHGEMNNRINASGTERRLHKHKMLGCRTECCGEFLDRRYLQYLGGNCECGLLIMEVMGIVPATEEQNKWKKELYDKRNQVLRRDEVRNLLEASFNTMNIYKPQMLVWYIMSQGRNRLTEIMMMKEEERIEELKGMVKVLNNEYGKHIPIQ